MTKKMDWRAEANWLDRGRPPMRLPPQTLCKPTTSAATRGVLRKDVIGDGASRGRGEVSALGRRQNHWSIAIASSACRTVVQCLLPVRLTPTLSALRS